MKKNYEKPCCSSMVVAVEQAMLAGSGVTVSNQNFTEEPHVTLGGSQSAGSKDNPFQNDED